MKYFKTQVVCVFMGITKMYWPIEDDLDPKLWEVFIESLPMKLMFENLSPALFMRRVIRNIHNGMN